MRVKQVDAVQFPHVPGCDGDCGLSEVLDFQQVFLQGPDRHFLVLGLRLKQDNGPNVIGVLLGRLSQGRAGHNRPVHRILPRGVFGQHDRQLDHLGLLQFLGRNTVQNVRFWLRCRGELDDGAGVEACLHFPGQAGNGVVRLVYDHQRLVEVQQVGKGELDPAACRLFQALCRIPNAGEVRLKVLVVSVDLAATGVFDTQGLGWCRPRYSNDHEGREAEYA